MGVALPVIAAISTIYSAYAQRQAGAAQAAMAKRNAEAENVAADEAAAAGSLQATRVAIKGGMLRSSQIAAYAASGVVPTSGSALDVLNDTALFTELDKETAQANASREAWGHRVASSNWNAQAALSRFEGNSAAISTLLEGAGDSYAMYQASSKFKKVKLPPTPQPASRWDFGYYGVS